jgi:hypothetical protein
MRTALEGPTATIRTIKRGTTITNVALVQPENPLERTADTSAKDQMYDICWVCNAAESTPNDIYSSTANVRMTHNKTSPIDACIRISWSFATNCNVVE